jgi:hypothetical protein
MRLLHSKTIEPREFPNRKSPFIPNYAILSHTWEEQEISFQDIQKPHNALHGTAGYEKIKQCCYQAASDGFEYVWIDTCCT